MTCHECGSGVRPAPPHPQVQGRGEGRLRTVTLDLRREVRTPWHVGCFRPAGREAARCLPGFARRLCRGRTASRPRTAPRERPHPRPPSARGPSREGRACARPVPRCSPPLAGPRVVSFCAARSLLRAAILPRGGILAPPGPTQHRRGRTHFSACSNTFGGDGFVRKKAA